MPGFYYYLLCFALLLPHWGSHTRHWVIAVLLVLAQGEWVPSHITSLTHAWPSLTLKLSLFFTPHDVHKVHCTFHTTTFQKFTPFSGHSPTKFSKTTRSFHTWKKKRPSSMLHPSQSPFIHQNNFIQYQVVEWFYLPNFSYLLMVLLYGDRLLIYAM